MSAQPAFRTLSLGAGVQSTTLFFLAAEGRIPRPDVAIFADTGWEPAAVYAHLDRIEREIAQPAGIPILRVTVGDIRADALDPAHKFVSMPTFTIGPCQVCIPRGTLGSVFNLTAEIDGKEYTDYTGVCPRCKGRGTQHGMGQRQCTPEYKIRPIKKKVRELLGYPHPMSIPADVHAEQQVGFSRDELGRVKDSGLRYLRSVFPLLSLEGAADGRQGWTRADCRRYLKAHGWESTPRSACVGCPFRGNREWREMRDERPAEWADAVAFDHALRAIPRADGIREYLHASRVPLDEAPIGRVTSHEWKSRQTDIFGQIADAELELGNPDGCGPWACRSGAAA
ncbi:hypothetical protein [Streptomyces sp. NPDC059828]|uniref:hypothetical protein n=1 Tax=Streptomyces sp. NPDC059828 TaxID=3346965 RepID=UPI0036492957